MSDFINTSVSANFSILSHEIIHHKNNTIPIWICMKYSKKVCKRTEVTRTVIIKIAANQLHCTLFSQQFEGNKYEYILKVKCEFNFSFSLCFLCTSKWLCVQGVNFKRLLSSRNWNELQNRSHSIVTFIERFTK